MFTHPPFWVVPIPYLLSTFYQGNKLKQRRDEATTISCTEYLFMIHIRRLLYDTKYFSNFFFSRAFFYFDFCTMCFLLKYAKQNRNYGKMYLMAVLHLLGFCSDFHPTSCLVFSSLSSNQKVLLPQSATACGALLLLQRT